MHDYAKQRMVRSWVHSNKPSLGCIIETRVQQSYCPSIIRYVFPGWNYMTNYEFHRLGRIWLLWSDSVTIFPLFKGPQIITVKVKGEADEEYILSAIYASNFLLDWRQLWQELVQVRDMFITRTTPWALIGDFNQILHPSDHSGSANHGGLHPGMNEFQQVIHDCDVFDLDYTGQKFTWWNHRENEPIGKKLDRVLVNEAWITSFPHSSAAFEANGLSDHSRSLVTTLRPTQRRQQHFQFFNFLKDLPQFGNEIQRFWSSGSGPIPTSRTALHEFHRKLKSLKPLLRSLNKEKYGEISSRANDAFTTLCNMQEQVLQNPSSDHFIEEAEAHSRWYHLASVEEKFLQQKSRVHWLKNGDQNTAFFHRTVKIRTSKNRICKLLTNGGGIITDPYMIKMEAAQHFKRILNPPQTHQEAQQPWTTPSLSSYRCPAEASAKLIAPITEAEIKGVLHSIPKNKAPGPDGFTAEFFIACWNTIGKDFTNAVQSFFIYGFMPRGVNATKLALIPKKDPANGMKDYRPIACCNIIYKVISKLLANRLKEILPDAIEKNQCAFVKGRLLLENVLLATELVKNYHRPNVSSRSVLKLDISKAFDTIRWNFILDILRSMGIPGRFINWISGCITKASFSVSVNGELEGFFKSTRGIRQGCSLSPYLFVLAMNALSLQLTARSVLGLIGFHPSCKEIKLNHLCFADDLMIFSDGTATSLQETMVVLGEFESMSGLRINPSKSSIFRGGSRHDAFEELARSLGIPLATLPIRYLGLPLTTRNMERKDFQPLIDSVRNRFLSWTSKSLSYGGRLQLIKSVIKSLTNFWSSVFRLPSKCFQIIDSLCSAFLWSGSPHITSKAKVAWTEVCKPQGEGGLGLRHLRSTSKVFSLNLIWRLMANHSSLWVAWTRHYLLRYSSFWDAHSSSRGSWIWRKLLKLKSLAKGFIRHEVNSGDQTSFWLDTWTTKGRLIETLGESGVRKLGIQRNAKVSDTVLGSSWNFRRCRDPLILQTISEISSMTPPNRDKGRDQVLWKHGELEYRPVFSSKKTWFQIRDRDQPVCWAKVVWFNQRIPRHAFIVWLAIKNRLATGNRTRRWGHASPCILCGERDETRDHLFFACPYSFTVWDSVSKNLDFRPNPDWEITLNSITQYRGTTRNHIILRLIFQASVYHIWRERNNRRHQTKHRHPRVLAITIKKEILHRLISLPNDDGADQNLWPDVSSFLTI